MWPIDQSIRKRTDPSRIQGNINKTVVIKSTGAHRLPLGAAFIVCVTPGVSAMFKAGRLLLSELPDVDDDWQLEQLIRHGQGTYWKSLLLL
jgi:hypothetical protein